jgi:hypothetical protein
MPALALAQQKEANSAAQVEAAEVVQEEKENAQDIHAAAELVVVVLAADLMDAAAVVKAQAVHALIAGPVVIQKVELVAKDRLIQDAVKAPAEQVVVMANQEAMANAVAVALMARAAVASVHVDALAAAATKVASAGLQAAKTKAVSINHGEVMVTTNQEAAHVHQETNAPKEANVLNALNVQEANARGQSQGQRVLRKRTVQKGPNVLNVLKEKNAVTEVSVQKERIVDAQDLTGTRNLILQVHVKEDHLLKLKLRKSAFAPKKHRYQKPLRLRMD